MDTDDPATQVVENTSPSIIVVPKLCPGVGSPDKVVMSRRIDRTPGHVEPGASWFRLPIRAVTLILDFWCDDLKNDAAAFAVGYPKHVSGRTQDLDIKARRFWSYLWLANVLVEMGRLSTAWESAVNEHDFWQSWITVTNKSWVVTFQDPFERRTPPRADSDNNSTSKSKSNSSSASNAPTLPIPQREVPPSRPHGKGVAYRASCKSNIWIAPEFLLCRSCLLDGTLSGRRKEQQARRWSPTTHLGIIQVCEYCYWDFCGVCMLPSDGNRTPGHNNIAANFDEDTFGPVSRTCAQCRYQAVLERAKSLGLPASLDYSRYTGGLCDFLTHGLGTVDTAIESVMYQNWLLRSGEANTTHRNLILATKDGRRLQQEWELEIGRGRYWLKDYSVWMDHHLSRLCGITPSSPKQLNHFAKKDSEGFIAKRLAAGWWVAPSEDLLHLPPQGDWMSNLRGDLTEPELLIFQTLAPSELESNEWCIVLPSLIVRPEPLTQAVAPAPPPAVFLAMPDNSYQIQLKNRVKAPLENLKEMIQFRTHGRNEIALAKAEAMTPSELIEWMKDPRTWVKQWWSRGDVAPVEEIPVVWSDSNGNRAEKRKRNGTEVVQREEAASDLQASPDDLQMELDSGLGRTEESQSPPGERSPFFQDMVAPEAKRRKSDSLSAGQGENGTSSASPRLPDGADDLRAQLELAKSSKDPSPIPQTPPLGTDDSEMTASSSDDSHGPAFLSTGSSQKAVSLDSSQRLGKALVPSFIAECLTSISWPTPRPRMTPAEVIVVKQKGLAVLNAQLVPFPGAAITPLTAEVLKNEWQELWMNERQCHCGVCQRLEAENQRQRAKMLEFDEQIALKNQMIELQRGPPPKQNAPRGQLDLDDRSGFYEEGSSDDDPDDLDVARDDDYEEFSTDDEEEALMDDREDGCHGDLKLGEFRSDW